MKSFIGILLLIAGFLFQPGVAVADAAEQIRALRAEIEALNQRLDQLEQANLETAGDLMARREVADRESWAGRIKLGGDFRYRHERIDEEGLPTRDRQRIRARAGLTAKLSETVKVGLGIASGGDNPVSTNQTLGDGASTKELGLNLAFFDWAATQNLHVLGGKFKNVFYRPGKSSLIWDPDLNTEGLGLSYDNGGFFGSLVGLWAEERSQASDSFVLGGHLGYAVRVADGAKLKFGAGYYDFSIAKGQEPFFDGNGRGNTLDENGNYAFGYEEVQAFAELGFQAAGLPAMVFVDYVQNMDGGELDTGYGFGGKIGKASKQGSWEIGYQYRDLEADAVVATFTDSDFAGGGTDGFGHILNGGYAITDSWAFKLTYFLNERGENAGNKRSFNRLMADLSFKY